MTQIKTLVITDLSNSLPESSLSTHRQKGKWKVMDYELGPYTGKLLTATHDTNAQPVRLDLNVTGWYEVYISVCGSIKAKLSSSSVYRWCQSTARLSGLENDIKFEELLLAKADLTGESIDLAQISRGYGVPIHSHIAYVKLVPIAPQEVEQIKADRQDDSQRTLAASFDGHGFFGLCCPTNEDEILESIEQYRHSDIGTLHINYGGAEAANYFSKVGHIWGVENKNPPETTPRPFDRFWVDTILDLAAKGINPTKVIFEGARKMGIKTHASIRPGGWTSCFPYEEFFTSPFYVNNPQWRCVDRDGTPVGRMSLAAAEVRSHLVNMLREAVQLGADGANVMYSRAVPYILWEQPFCEMFSERYGLDAHKIDENDERIIALRCEIITSFMQEIRNMLDEEQKRRGSDEKLVLSAYVLPDEQSNLGYGLDIRSWIANGLVDELSPYMPSENALSRIGIEPKNYDLDFFKDVCNQAGVPWQPTIMTRLLTVESLNSEEGKKVLSNILSFNEARATGITIFNPEFETTAPNDFYIMSRLGHVDEIKNYLENTIPPVGDVHYLRRLGQEILDGQYGIAWGY